MGIWNTKFRNPALVAGLLAISLAANPALAREGGSKRGGAGFAGGALVGAAAGGPVGMVVGAMAGGLMGERSHQKQEQLARRKAEAALLAGQVESLETSLSGIEGKAGQVWATVQFRTGETSVRDNDRARIAKLGALVAGLPNVRVRVSGFADSRGGDDAQPDAVAGACRYRGARAREGGAAQGAHGRRGHGRAIRQHRGQAGRPGLRALRRDPLRIGAVRWPATECRRLVGAGRG